MEKFKDLLEEISNLKAKIDTIGPIDPAQTRNIDDWYRIELTYTSNALEGSTLSRQETAMVVEKDISPEGKSLQELLEAKNHAKAFDFIRSKIADIRSFGDITVSFILDIHGKILQKIDDTNAGKLRIVPVRIAGSTAVMPNAAKVPELMSEFIDWLHSSNDYDDVTRAIEAHYRFVSIHPFVDGNGRVARLLMNLLLMQKSCPPLIVPKESRRAYVTSLEKGQTTGDTDDYYRFMYERMIDSMKEYLKMIK